MSYEPIDNVHGPPCRASSATAAPTHTSTLSLHDALPISRGGLDAVDDQRDRRRRRGARARRARERRHDGVHERGDRKSTRLNSSHRCISYAVFCLKKKNQLRYALVLYTLLRPQSCHSLAS